MNDAIPASTALSIPELFANLAANDPEFRAAVPDPAINAAKTLPELGLAQIVAVCMEGYADRPALARRAVELVTDPATSRRQHRILKHFETISYRELWSRAKALAAFWSQDDGSSLGPGDLLCIMGFGDADL